MADERDIPHFNKMANESKQTAVDWLINEWMHLDAEFDMVLLDKNTYWEKLKEKHNQAKKMEKQQMIRFAEFVATHTEKNRNVYGEMLHAKSKYDGSERTVDLLEQYYQQTFGK